MKIEILEEGGYYPALLGMGLSKGLTSNLFVDEVEDAVFNYKNGYHDKKSTGGRIVSRSIKLCQHDSGHNKFLESIQVWLDITAARCWWQQFDTYRVGVTKQSESTMHTLMKRELTQVDFEQGIFGPTLDRLNDLIARKEFDQLKDELPEGFLQRRIVCLNYKAIRHIVGQRHKHKLAEWKQFCKAMYDGLEHSEFLPEVTME